MNTPREDFDQALEQLVRLYRCLADVAAQVQPHNEAAFGMLAEADLEHIRRLEKTVANLGGRRAAEAYEQRHHGGPETGA